MSHQNQHQEFASTLPQVIIEQNVSLADKNWFQTGGLAKFFAEPTTAEQFAQALEFAQKNNLEISIKKNIFIFFL